MKHDPIVEEVRGRGRALTARFGNDPRALLRVLEEQARKHPDTVVDTVTVVREERRERGSGTSRLAET